MIIFVDESGIHKQVDHSTFALVYVAIEDREEIEHGVAAIERQRNIENFHWAEHGWAVREKFFQEVVKLPFFVKVAIFKNPIHPSQSLEWALLHLLVEKDFDRLYIEGKKPRWVEHQIRKTLRDKGISIQRLKTVRHESSGGVRLADAFAGLSRSYYDTHSEKSKRLWTIAQKKITTQLLGGQGYE